MESLNENVIEYKKQMEKGIIQKAYRGIMDYVMQLRTFIKNKYPELSVGNIYSGYMDMTYFPLFPKILKSRKLKIAIVFIHETCRFEVWLSGNNRQVQQNIRELIRENNWNKYQRNPNNADSIIESTLDDNPNFSDPDALSKKIETSTLSFIKDIEKYFSKHKNHVQPNTRLQATWPRLSEKTPNCDCRFPDKMVFTLRMWPCG
jgi:hypothetical protein